MLTNSKQKTLEDYLREAVQHFRIPETMDAKVVFDFIEKKGGFTDQELKSIHKFRSKMKSRPRNINFNR